MWIKDLKAYDCKRKKKRKIGDKLPDEKSPRGWSKIGLLSTEIYAGRSSDGIDIRT